MHASFCKVIWLAGAAQAKKNSSKNSETLDRQIALQVSGKRCIFDLGMKRLFKTLPRCCESPIQETTTAQIGQQQHNAHCQRYQCCLQSIVKVKDNKKVKLQLGCTDMSVSGLFHPAAIPSSCNSFLAAFCPFMYRQSCF